MQKTIFMILDACQYEAATRNLGYLEHRIDYGQGAKYKVRGELPSMSRPMYATLLTGRPVYQHGITANEVCRKLACESVLSRCKEEGGITAAACYHWMSELYNHAPFQIPEERMQLSTGENIEHGIYYWSDDYPDAYVVADGEFLRKTYQPDFLMIHAMHIDYAGHNFFAGSKEYEDSIGLVGNLIAVHLPMWLEDGYQVVITADHGMNALGIHGGVESDQRDTPLYIFSPQIKNGRFDDHYISQLNIAPMLCRLLGIQPAETMRKEVEIEFA